MEKTKQPINYETFKRHLTGNTLFRNKDALNPNFMLDRMYFRDDVLKSLIMNFRGIIKEESTSTNFLLIGPGGSGKTMISRFFTNFLRKACLELVTEYELEVLYYNCVQFRSLGQIIRNIAVTLDLPEKGYSHVESLSQIFRSLKIKNKFLFLILDEIHVLKKGDLFRFLNLAETFGHKNTRLSSLLITRITNWGPIESERILSRLNNNFTLKPYSIDETTLILKERARLALKEDIISDKNIEKIAKIAFKHENLRHGITILRNSTLMAEKQGLPKIPFEIIDQVSEQAYSKYLETIEKLRPHELLAFGAILEALKLHGVETTTNETSYSEYENSCAQYNIKPHVMMNFRKYVKNLRDCGLVGAKSVKLEGSGGRHLEIWSKKPLEIRKPIKKIIEKLLGGTGK